MQFLLALIVAVTIYCATAASLIINPTEYLGKSLFEWKAKAEQWLQVNNRVFAPDPNYPYWNFFPIFVTSVFEKRSPVEWSSPCFSQNKAWISRSSDGSTLNLEIISSNDATGNEKLPPIFKECVDTYSFASGAFHELLEISPSRIHASVVKSQVNFSLDSSVTDAEFWDLAQKGLRIFRYRANATTTLSNFILTVDLFKADITGEITEQGSAWNKDMCEKYTHTHIFNPIPAGSLTPPEASRVHSGDFFGIMGLDGMGSMMSWAMGSTTSHTTVALWIDNELNVCESTGDGVQCNPYEFFLNRYKNNHVVWVPLSEESHQKFNATSAYEYFKTINGLQYGFQTLLWTWIDTETNNFPCVGPDFSSGCMTAEWSEVFMMLMDRGMPEIGALIWNPGFAKRLGVSDKLRTAELIKIGYENGFKRWTQLAVVPELDSWNYNTTKSGAATEGPAMTCCVFVCNIWKAAGVFDEDLAKQFQCAELSNWDDYVLTILAPTYTQINGNYSLVLNNYNSKSPYANMGDTCASKNPDYPREADC